MVVTARPPDRRHPHLVKTAAQLRFRAVIQEAAAGVAATPTPTATGTGTPGHAHARGHDLDRHRRLAATPSSSATSSTAGRAIPKALSAATHHDDRPPHSTAASSPTPAPPAAKPTDASDPNWVTPAIQAQFDAETCTDLNKFQGNTDSPDKPFVTCSTDGTTKYILGPAEVSGTDISGASAQLADQLHGRSADRPGRSSSTSTLPAPRSSGR